MCSQTPFQAAGYTENDTFVVYRINEDSQFSLGSMIKLKHDDNSTCPYFELVQGHCESSTGCGYEDLNFIIKIAKNQTPFEAAGYTKNDRFINPSHKGSFKGIVYKLSQDDGSNCPYLKSVTPDVNKQVCLHIDKLLKIRL